MMVKLNNELKNYYKKNKNFKTKDIIQFIIDNTKATTNKPIEKTCLLDLDFNGKHPVSGKFDNITYELILNF